MEHGAKDRGQTIAYSRVFAAAGLPAPQELHNGGDSHLVTAFMHAFHLRCRERDLPPLDSLVVHVAGPRKGFPGAGYFRVNEQPDPLSDKATADDVARGTAFWEAQKKTCEQWGTEQRRRRG